MRYTERNAIAEAILRNEKTYNGVDLPSPQVAGTYTQQRTYALLCADQIIRNSNSKQ